MAQLQNTTINDTGFLTVAGGSTAQRPSPTAGMIRLNTSNNLLEFYDSAGWRPITGVSSGSIGTGGDSILYAASNLGRGNGVVHIFTAPGAHTFTPAFTGTVEVLVVGGGGGGGAHLGAGGGAGGVQNSRAFPVSAGTGIPITVGAGAAKVPAYSQSSNDGSNSVFGSITANGGGGGGSWDGYAGRPGASGGGGCPGSNGSGSNGHTGPNDSRNKNLGGRGIVGQGFPGGNGMRFNRQGEDSHRAGGGGGATHHGNSTLSASGGIGGGGGSTQTHGGPRYPGTHHGNGVGGGFALDTGAGGNQHYHGGNGGDNTGGGGGGAHGDAGSGGSGIVIVKY